MSCYVTEVNILTTRGKVNAKNSHLVFSRRSLLSFLLSLSLSLWPSTSIAIPLEISLVTALIVVRSSNLEPSHCYPRMMFIRSGGPDQESGRHAKSTNRQPKLMTFNVDSKGLASAVFNGGRLPPYRCVSASLCIRENVQESAPLVAIRCLIFFYFLLHFINDAVFCWFKHLVYFRVYFRVYFGSPCRFPTKSLCSLYIGWGMGREREPFRFVCGSCCEPYSDREPHHPPHDECTRCRSKAVRHRHPDTFTHSSWLADASI